MPEEKLRAIELKDLLPNSFQVPNLFVDDILKYLTGSEAKLMIFLMRKTFGWIKENDKISITQFQKGAGLSRQCVIDGLSELVKLQIIKKTENKSGNFYGMNIKWESEVIDGSLKNRPVYLLDYQGLKNRPVGSLKIRHTKPTVKPTPNKTKNGDSPKEGESLPQKSKVREFQDEWKKQHPNKDYIVTNYKKWGGQVKDLLESVELVFNGQGYSKLVEFRKRYFQSKKKWHVESGYSFDVFMSDINSFIAKKNEKSAYQKNLEELGVSDDGE